MQRMKGFTLIEMAIVLVIIGLIIGVSFTASTMVRSSQMQNMLGEYDSYVKAVNEFNDKFLALPGDMLGSAGNRPEDMWGTDPGGCPGTPPNTVPKIATCNGSGFGTIGTSDFSANLGNSQEWYRAWQQLADAKLIPGKFTGVRGPNSAQESLVGLNVPASSLSGAGWTLAYYLLNNAGGGLWPDQYGHVLMLGGYVIGGPTTGPIIKPGEALSIDSKIDDGMPGTGKVRAWRPAVLASCTTNDGAQTTQSYDISLEGNYACSLVFLLGI